MIVLRTLHHPGHPLLAGGVFPAPGGRVRWDGAGLKARECCGDKLPCQEGSDTNLCGYSVHSSSKRYDERKPRKNELN